MWQVGASRLFMRCLFHKVIGNPSFWVRVSKPNFLMYRTCILVYHVNWNPTFYRKIGYKGSHCVIGIMVSYAHCTTSQSMRHVNHFENYLTPLNFFTHFGVACLSPAFSRWLWWWWLYDNFYASSTKRTGHWAADNNCQIPLDTAQVRDEEIVLYRVSLQFHAYIFKPNKHKK